MSPPPIPTQDKDTARIFPPPIPTQDEDTARMSPRIFPPNEDSPEAEQVIQKVVEPAKELPYVLHVPGCDVAHDGPAVSDVVEEPHHPPEVQVYLSLHGGDMCDEQVSVNDDQGGNFECFSPRSFLPQQLLPSISCLDKPTHPTPAQHLYLSPAMLHHLLHITQPPLPKVRATPPPQAVLTQTVRVHLLGCAEEC